MMMDWTQQAAENLKWVFTDELQFVAPETIARRLSEAYENEREFNEVVRESSQLQPEEKLWIVVP
ncbi:MAG TPA: hypothetical protein PLP16_13335 [Smithellaceae bacterium]|nr:hypothetical protein [Smithellaceae bacterium]